MRVLHVISALTAGGAEVLVKDLSQALIEQGDNVAIAYISSAEDQGNDAAIEERFRLELVSAGISLFELGHVCRKNIIRGGIQLRRAIKQFRPDVLHIHLGLGLAFRSLCMVSVPTVYTHHNTIFKFGLTVGRVFDIFIDHYVAISSGLEQLLKLRTGKPVTLIRNGISNRRIARRSPSRGVNPFKVLSVGRISPQKNYHSIVKIANILRQRHGLTADDLQFNVCGDGRDLDVMRENARSAGVSDLVHFLGGCNDVPERMADSDTLLMTSLYEGMPITLIEAAFAGLPMIATDVGGCSEIVHSNQNGFLFTPDDHDAAAVHILKIMNDHILRKNFSTESLRIAKKFSMDEVCSKHRMLYSSMTGHRRA